jgi:hypothetical protein
MFVVGLGYVFLDAIRRRSQRQGIAAVVAGLATALTAHGLGVWVTLLDFLRNREALDLIAEWKPPDFSNPFVVPLLIIIIGIIVAGTLGKLEPQDLWIVVPFVVFGVMAGRNIWPAAMVLAPIAARSFWLHEPEERQRRSEPFVLNWAIAVVLIGVAAIGVVRPIELREDRFPSEAAVAALERAPLFNGTAVGGYLIYDAWPDIRVFVDDRAELYGAEGIQRFLDLKSGVGVSETFEELNIHQAILTIDWPIVGFLELLGWNTLYRDEFFVVMADS